MNRTLAVLAAWETTSRMPEAEANAMTDAALKGTELGGWGSDGRADGRAGVRLVYGRGDGMQVRPYAAGRGVIYRAVVRSW